MSVWVACTGMLACGGGGDDDDEGPSCGTAAAPQLLTVSDVQPAAGSSVPNSAITHAFTVVGVAAIFNPSWTLTAAHTAGAPDPLQLMLSVDTSNPDVRYTMAPIRWTNAPGEVLIQSTNRFMTNDGCTYAFPTPLFSYSVTAPD